MNTELGGWISLVDRKPEEKHANNDGHVNFQMGSYSMSGVWQFIPEQATHWQMMLDSPPTDTSVRYEEIKERAFQDAFKELFPNPILERGLMEPTARKLFEAGTHV